ncbi:hypothetical protein, partial [Paraclostridium bifermentans]|uniref:hypothetical protein n=1 Tax=Paraclostridium bifermentans TaxID=1490 RepID=UPI0024327239
MNVMFGADSNDQAIKFDDKSKINVKSNDVVVFNIMSNDNNKFSSSVSTLNSDIGKALGGFDLKKITHDEGVTSYKNAMVDGGSITIDKDISKSDEKKAGTDEKAESNDNSFGYFYFKRFLGQRLKTTVNENIKIDATIGKEAADNYYDGKVTGLEIVSSQNAKTVDETSLTMKKGSSIVANRLSGDTKDNTVGVFSDYAVITMKDGSSITVEETTNSRIRDDKFTGIGIFAVNGSQLRIGEDKETPDSEKAKITVHGDNAIGIYAKANRSSYDGDKETIVENEYGTDAEGQGKIDIKNNGVIDVSNGFGTIGIYANNNSTNKEITNSIIENSGLIKTGNAKEGTSSVGIIAKTSQIKNSGVIEVRDGDGNGNIGIHAIEESTIKDIGTIKLGKYAIGVLVDEESKIVLDDKKNSVKFEALNENSDLKIGIAYANKNNTTRDHDFDVNAENVKGIKVIAQKGGTLNITETSNITINDEDSAGVIVTEGTINNNGTINIEKLSDETKATGDKKVSVGILATGKDTTINNKGSINLNGDNAVGIYVKNDNNSSKNILEEVGKININGNNNKGIYVNNSNDKTAVKGKDLEGISFGENATQSTGLYLKNSEVKFNLKDEAVSKELGKENAGNIFIKAINTNIENSGKLVISSSDDRASRENSGNQKNIGILLDEKSTYKGSKLNNDYGILEVMNGAIGMYSMVGEKKEFTDIKLAVDSQNKDTIGLVLKGKEDASSRSKVELYTTTGRTNQIELKNTEESQVESNANHRNSIGIVAKDVDLNIRRVDLNYNKSNGIGLYLKANSSITGGTLNITGSGKENHNGHTDYSIGIYAGENSGEKLKATLNIGKDDSIGIFNDRKGLVYNGSITGSYEGENSDNAIGIYTNKDLTFAGGTISMKGGENEKEAAAGIYSEGKKD